MTGELDPAVEVTDLVKVYRRPGGGDLRALNGISFEVKRGEIFGLLGLNHEAVGRGRGFTEGIPRFGNEPHTIDPQSPEGATGEQHRARQ